MAVIFGPNRRFCRKIGQCLIQIGKFGFGAAASAVK
jgi:hypothetical protein